MGVGRADRTVQPNPLDGTVHHFGDYCVTEKTMSDNTTYSVEWESNVATADAMEYLAWGSADVEVCDLGRVYDPGGHLVATVAVEPTEDDAPYLAALAAAGFQVVSTATGIDDHWLVQYRKG